MLKKTTYEIATSAGYLTIGLETDDLVIRHYNLDGVLTCEVLSVEATRGFMAELTEAVSEIEREVIG